MLSKLFYHKGHVSLCYKRLLLYSGTVSALTSAEYAISTHCLLNTISSTTALTANFITKDMVGQIGGLLILSKLKGWSSGGLVVGSCVLIQAGVMADVMVMELPEYVIPLTVFSTMVKNVSFTLISSVNVRALNRVVPREAVGEAYIGYSALSTVASSVGMAVGLGLVEYGMIMPVVGMSGVVRYYLLKKIEGLREPQEIREKDG